jgi:hypothetical protein
MKKMIVATFLSSVVSDAVIGCTKTDQSFAKGEAKIVSPRGTTAVNTESDVEMTGETPSATTQ